MLRIARVTPCGMVFHVLNRGVGRMRLFLKDADFGAFERIIAKTVETRPMRICAYRLMSNLSHLVPWPERDEDLRGFMQKLTFAHFRNCQENRQRAGYGHLYQGRYKSFPIESDDHFYQVTRYVERNPLRANLVSRPQDWRWSNLWRRVYGIPEDRRWLSEWPLRQPRAWTGLVNQPQTESELEAIRRAVTLSQPYGGEEWVQITSKHFGLESTLRSRGRLFKNEP